MATRNSERIPRKEVPGRDPRVEHPVAHPLDEATVFDDGAPFAGDPLDGDPTLHAEGAPQLEPAAAGRAERRRRIQERAYARAEQRGFAPGRELDDWLAAEAEENALGRNADRRASEDTGSDTDPDPHLGGDRDVHRDADRDGPR